MAGDAESLTLHLLRRLDERTERMAGNILEVKQRMTALEGHVASLHGDFAGQSLRIDRIEQRLERIERGLDLVRP